MNVGIILSQCMECMCPQTRPRFILSSERVLGNGVRTQVNSKGKSLLLEAQKRIESMPLHQAGQRSQHTIDSAIVAPGGDTTPLSAPGGIVA